MGLTNSSTGSSLLTDDLELLKSDCDYVIALAGNPNVGKSTIFNNLTGMHQHTGNWPGKTVGNSTGRCSYKNKDFLFVDIPGTYSIMSNSEEEEIARDYICFGHPDCTVVVVDATCLERNLNFVFQTMEITNNIIVCVNLLDEAKKKKIHIDLDLLAVQLGVPVVGVVARKKKTLDKLMETINDVCSSSCSTFSNEVVSSKNCSYSKDSCSAFSNEVASSKNCSYSKDNSFSKKLSCPHKVFYCDIVEDSIAKISNVLQLDFNLSFDLARWVSLKLIDGDVTILKSIEKNLDIELLHNNSIQDLVNSVWEILRKNDIHHNSFRDLIVSSIMHRCEAICTKVCVFEDENYSKRDRIIDRFLTSKVFGIPVMLLFLAVIFWLTIVGSNYPSEFLFSVFAWFQDKLVILADFLHFPDWLSSLLISGVYQTLTWIVSVMLPPMAIFFPLFTVLEDLGYLPRIAFNMDGFFKKCCCTR